MAKELENISRKEAEMEKAGASRKASYRALAEALSADSVTIDKYGDEHIFPDHGTRLRAAEIIAGMNGDKKAAEISIESKTINIGIAGDISGLIELAGDVRKQLAELRGSGRQTGEILDIVPTRVS